MSACGLRVMGIGILNGLGLSREVYWHNLLRGECGIAPISEFETAGYRARSGAQIRGFDPKAFMPPRFYRRLSRLSRLAVAASIEALSDSGLAITDHNRRRIGTVFGTAYGSTDQTDAFFVSLLESGPEGAEPILFPDTVPNALASHVAIFHQVQGPNSTLCENHLSGECALAYAHSLLNRGRADAVIVGGADEISPIAFHCLDAVGALKRERPADSPCRPSFPPTGSGTSPRGFTAGEGATCLLLERASPEDSQPAGSYGTVSALAMTGARSSQGHYEPSGDSLVRVMCEVLEESGVSPEEVDVIGSSANGVQELEVAEERALEVVFGRRWPDIPRVPLRTLTGEFGSAGLLSVATLLLALREGILPPHVVGREPAGKLVSSFQPAPAQLSRLRHAMAIGSTFGGGSSCALLTAPSSRIAAR